MLFKETIIQMKKQREEINEKLTEHAKTLSKLIHYENDNPRTALDKVLSLEEFQKVMEVYAEIRKVNKAGLSLVGMAIGIFFIVEAIITLLGISALFVGTYFGTQNTFDIFSIIDTFSTGLFSLIMVAAIIVVLKMKYSPKKTIKKPDKVSDIGFCYLRSAFMQGIIPDQYSISAYSNQGDNAYAKYGEICKDCRKFFYFDKLEIRSLIEYEGGKDHGYYSEIRLQDEYEKSDGETEIKDIFKGFIGTKKFNLKQNYFDEEEGFYIYPNRKNKNKGILFNMQELNETLEIRPVGKSDNLSFKIKQFLSPGTEELIYMLKEEYGSVRIMVSNYGITVIIWYPGSFLFGDSCIGKSDCKYQALYHEYEKVYCVEVLYKRLLRNMEGIVDSHMENETQKWLTQKLNGIKQCNNEWDKWIDSIWKN